MLQRRSSTTTRGSADYLFENQVNYLQYQALHLDSHPSSRSSIAFLGSLLEPLAQSSPLHLRCPRHQPANLSSLPSPPPVASAYPKFQVLTNPDLKDMGLFSDICSCEHNRLDHADMQNCTCGPHSLPGEASLRLDIQQQQLPAQLPTSLGMFDLP